jgi:hypothetical protein
LGDRRDHDAVPDLVLHVLAGGAVAVSAALFALMTWAAARQH